MTAPKVPDCSVPCLDCVDGVVCTGAESGEVDKRICRECWRWVLHPATEGDA